MRKGVLFTCAAGAAAIVALTVGAGQADANCQVQWEPDPFGDSGGSLGIVCGGPNAPTGNVDGSAGKTKTKKKKKPPPSHASIAVNLTTLNDGDLAFVGAYSAGYDSKRKAVRASERACRRDQPGECDSIVSARNGWAVLVATLTPDRRLVVFGGSAKSYDSAFQEAEERARDAFGGAAPFEIQRVRGVR
ncbi:MAG: DUF4189 domain-containing protein, partial [Solirubrobacterales bacterium]